MFNLNKKGIVFAAFVLIVGVVEVFVININVSGLGIL